MFDKCETERIWREIAAMNQSREKERKRLFREIAELKKEISALKTKRRDSVLQPELNLFKRGA